MVPKQTYVTSHRHISNQLEHGSISAKTAPWKSHPTPSHDMLTIRRSGCDGTSHRNLKKKNTTLFARALSRASFDRARSSVRQTGQGKNNREPHRENHDHRVEGKCEYGSTEKHLRKHRPKQDRDKPSTGVGTVVVLPSVPLSLHRGSCDDVLVIFFSWCDDELHQKTDANDKFFSDIEEHYV